MKNVIIEVIIRAKSADGLCSESHIASSERKRTGEFSAEEILKNAKKMIREIRDDFEEFMEPVIEKELEEKENQQFT